MNGLALIRCPYCGLMFEENYYALWHVPCPNPKGDKDAQVGAPSDHQDDRGSAQKPT